MMTSKEMPSATPETVGPKAQSLGRAIKVAAVALAVLYAINGTGAAAGYAKALPMGDQSSMQTVAQTVWVGVAWPLVLHDMMQADPFRRVDAGPDFAA